MTFAEYVARANAGIRGRRHRPIFEAVKTSLKPMYYSLRLSDTGSKKKLDTLCIKVYSGSMDMRIRSVPDDLHWKFKLACTERHITINQRVIQLIEADVKKYEKEKEKK